MVEEAEERAEREGVVGSCMKEEEEAGIGGVHVCVINFNPLLPF